MYKNLKRAGIIFTAIFVTLGLLNLENLAMAVVPGINERVSLRSTGGQAVNGGNGNYISANGKVVVFNSSTTNILPSGGKGIFARTLANGSIVRVNMSTAGVVSNDPYYTSMEKISATGRYIIFRSAATNLIDGTTVPASPSQQQLYLRDTVASTTTLISQNLAGVMSNGYWNESLGVSSDGRFISFLSDATNLHADATDGKSHLYMLDQVDNTISVLDRKPDGTVGTATSAWSPNGEMSCDGSFIVFQYPGGSLVPGDTTTGVRVVLLDRRGDTNKFTNVTGTGSNQYANSPTISCNGDYIGFRSVAVDLDPSVSPSYYYNKWRPYIYDRVNNTYHFAAITTSGIPTNEPICGNSSQSGPCIEVSDTGIGSFAANDSSLTGVSGMQAYIRDVNSGTTQLLSRDSAGAAGNGDSGMAGLSADGRLAAYGSGASNLVAGDTNGMYDMFVSQTGY